MVECMYIRVHHVPKKKYVQMAIKESRRRTERKHFSRNRTPLLYRIHTLHALEDMWEQFVFVI